MTPVDVDPQVAAAAVISAVSLGLGVVVGSAAVRSLKRASVRRAQRSDGTAGAVLPAKVRWIGAGMLIVATGSLAMSFLALWQVTGSPLLGFFLDAAVIMLMALQLVGVRAAVLSVVQWVILGVSIWANAQVAWAAPTGGEVLTETAKWVSAALHGCQPLVLKAMLIGFKHLVSKYIDQIDDSNRVPLSHWVHEPRAAWWITKHLGIGALTSYAEGCLITNGSIRRKIEMRKAKEPCWWKPVTWRFPVSYLDEALAEQIAGREEAAAAAAKRRTRTPPSKTRHTSAPQRTEGSGEEAAEDENTSARPRLTVAAADGEDGDERRERHLAEIEEWLAGQKLDPSGTNVAAAARKLRLPYAKKTAALRVAKELRERRAAS